ncbi:hypothetical protein CISG_02025 [Coccidioides immitis RMSCC 3703]|uniref:Uncharacterized protein n=1 Tax=Coccidioides immitis RMSCC 3703 TaxID=454286 RepID=A0A0J8U056_COCIT|nr:hypothetical protein CISG_02025 [Coccidioides immitis RMSCC 3703]
MAKYPERVQIALGCNEGIDLTLNLTPVIVPRIVLRRSWPRAPDLLSPFIITFGCHNSCQRVSPYDFLDNQYPQNVHKG